MTLTHEQYIKLADLRRYATRYEVVLLGPAGQQYLIGYTRQTSRRGLYAMIGSVWQSIREAAALPRGVVPISVNRRGARYWSYELSNGWCAKFSNRTEREAILNGELRPVASVSQP